MNRRQLAGLSLITLTMLAFAWVNQTYFVYLPIVALAPTFTPTHTPTITPTPTVTPTSVPCQAGPTASTQFFASQGVQGVYFRLKAGQSNCVTPGQDVWFEFAVRNDSGQYRDYGGLGAFWCTNKAGGQCTQASYDANLQIGEYLDPEDHLNIYTSGTYQVQLGICWLASRTDCENNPGSWTALSNPITVVIR